MGSVSELVGVHLYLFGFDRIESRKRQSESTEKCELKTAGLALRNTSVGSRNGPSDSEIYTG